MRTESQDILEAIEGRGGYVHAGHVKRLAMLVERQAKGLYSEATRSVLHNVVVPAVCLRGLLSCLARAQVSHDFQGEQRKALPYMRLLASVSLPADSQNAIHAAHLETTEIAYLIFRRCNTSHRLILNATAELYGFIGGDSFGRKQFRIPNRIRMACISPDLPVGYSWITLSLDHQGDLALHGDAQDLISQQKASVESVLGCVSIPPPFARECMAAFRFYAMTYAGASDTHVRAHRTVDAWHTVFILSLFGMARS